jgi:hypothetical protein
MMVEFHFSNSGTAFLLSAFLIRNLRQFVKFADKKHRGKSSIKRDGPVFFSSPPVILAGDERTIMAIVAPRRGEAPVPP